MSDVRVTIDDLPEQTTPEDSNMFIVQDSGVSKRMSVGTLKTIASNQLTAHLTDITDAHDASAISTTDSGGAVDGGTVQSQLGQLVTVTDTKVTNGGGVSTIRALTQAAYDALGTPDPSTLYIITT